MRYKYISTMCYQKGGIKNWWNLNNEGQNTREASLLLPLCCLGIDMLTRFQDPDERQHMGSGIWI